MRALYHRGPPRTKGLQGRSLAQAPWSGCRVLSQFKDLRGHNTGNSCILSSSIRPCSAPALSPVPTAAWAGVPGKWHLASTESSPAQQGGAERHTTCSSAFSPSAIVQGALSLSPGCASLRPDPSYNRALKQPDSKARELTGCPRPEPALTPASATSSCALLPSEEGTHWAAPSAPVPLGPCWAQPMRGGGRREVKWGHAFLGPLPEGSLGLAVPRLEVTPVSLPFGSVVVLAPGACPAPGFSLPTPPSLCRETSLSTRVCVGLGLSAPLGTLVWNTPTI